MNRLIRATSDRIAKKKDELDKIARALEKEAQEAFKVKSLLYSDIYIVPTMENGKIGAFFPSYKAIAIVENAIEDEGYAINILKHELSHALDYAINGLPLEHGRKFRQYASFFSIDEGFDKARVRESLDKSKRDSERIEKLFRLSESPFEEEAMSALRKALMLSERSKREIDDKKLYFAELYEKKRISYPIQAIGNIVAEATSVFLIKCKNEDNSAFSLRCYGSLYDTELAIYLFDHLVDSMKREIKRLRNSGERITLSSFSIGAVENLRKQLYKSYSEALIALDEKKRENKNLALSLVFKNGVRKRKSYIYSFDEKSYSMGKTFGEKTPLFKEIKERELK